MNSSNPDFYWFEKYLVESSGVKKSLVLDYQNGSYGLEKKWPK